MSGFEEVRQQDKAQRTKGLEQSGTEASQQRQVAKEFSRALRRAQKAAASGKPEVAVGWCRYAASLAWEQNPGFFYCHELEHLLAEVGRKHLRSGLVTAPRAEPLRRFLHLISPDTAYEIGGSSRAVFRWIKICAQHAPSEHHSILVTRQRDDPIPTWLGDSARETGGAIIELPSGLTWLRAAEEIRSRSLEFDAIVLHIHPNDPLPNLALYDQPRPILYFRHSDHLFNLGLDLARVIADVRPVGRKMSEHFCAAAPRIVMLPLPLSDEESFSCSKAEARQKLGFAVDALVILTVGWPHKFIPADGYDFSQVVLSLCAANSRVQIVAVGPSESAPFPGLKQTTGGRFLPVGTVTDREILELYYRATDIYLDAYPTGSGTAVLDAALHGLPVQRLYNQYRCLLWSDDPALDSIAPGASTQDEFIRTVLEWLEWPEERRSELGSRFRNAILEDHCGASWKRKWLDPAIEALGKSAENNLNSEQDYATKREPSFPGLGIAGPVSDWPAGMFVAGTILDMDDVPRSIRIHGVLHSIKPLLFNVARDGTTRRRFLMFRNLVVSCLSMRIRTPLRKMRLAIFKKRRRQHESAG